MLKKIRLLLEYGAYPVWLYDEDGFVIDTLLPEELRSDAELDSKFDDLQERYNALFIDNPREFSYVGFHSDAEREQFAQDWNAARAEFLLKIDSRYIIQDDVDVDKI